MGGVARTVAVAIGMASGLVASAGGMTGSAVWCWERGGSDMLVDAGNGRRWICATTASGGAKRDGRDAGEDEGVVGAIPGQPCSGRTHGV
jgi:hypothetical protein